MTYGNNPNRTRSGAAKTLRALEIEFFVNFVWKRAKVYPRGGVRTVSVANPTNGYAAAKGISKVVSDGEWNP